MARPNWRYRSLTRDLGKFVARVRETRAQPAETPREKASRTRVEFCLRRTLRQLMAMDAGELPGAYVHYEIPTELEEVLVLVEQRLEQQRENVARDR